MAKHNTTKRQKGFFDLGFSLAILALSGAFAYAVTPDSEATAVAQDTQIEITANLETENGNIDLQ